MAAVVDTFRHPDASGVVDVDVGGVVEEGGGGPDGDFEIGGKFKEIEVNEFGVEIRCPWGVGVLGWSGSADNKLHAGLGGFAVTDGTAVIESGDGGESHGTFWDFDFDGRFGVGAETFFVDFSSDGEGFSSCGFIDAEIPPALFVIGDEFFGERNFLSVFVLKSRFDPVGPVV